MVPVSLSADTHAESAIKQPNTSKTLQKPHCRQMAQVESAYYLVSVLGLGTPRFVATMECLILMYAAAVA